MPLSNGCPCGAHVAPAYDAVSYLSEGIIESLVASSEKFAKFKGLLLAWIGQAIYTQALCAAPKQSMPDFSLADFANLSAGALKVGQAINNKAYDLLCECDDCPPITNCNQGTNVLTVTPDDGYLADNEVQKRYHIPTGADLWVERSDGQCLGLKNGIWVYWNYADNTLADLTSVNVRDGNDSAPGDTWDPDLIGSGVTIYFSGEQTPDTVPWPAAPAGVQDFIGPPACTTSDICTALDYVYESVRKIEFLSSVVAGPLYGLTASIDLDLPGLTAPVTGTLTEVLGRAFTAIAPIQATQLANSVTTQITEATLIPTVDLAYVNIRPTVVPAWVGYRGEGDTTVYYSNHRQPGPGWAVVFGAAGVLSYHELLWPDGAEFVIPLTATGIAVEPGAGVTVEVTTWQRRIP